MSAVATAALHFHTIWISDTHLGTTGCQAGRLLEFLRCTESLTALVEKPDGTLEILHWQALAGSDPTPDPEESFIDAHPDRYRRLVAAG